MDSILDSVGSLVGVGKSAAVEKENAKLKAENERIRKAFPNAVKNKVAELTQALVAREFGIIILCNKPAFINDVNIE